METRLSRLGSRCLRGRFGQPYLACDLDIGGEGRRLVGILVMHEEVAPVFAGRQAIEGKIELEEQFPVMRARSDLNAANLLEGA